MALLPCEGCHDGYPDKWRDPKMTDQDFDDLKESIKEAFQEFERLQKQYVQEVGQRYHWLK